MHSYIDIRPLAIGHIRIPVHKFLTLMVLVEDTTVHRHQTAFQGLQTRVIETVFRQQFHWGNAHADIFIASILRRGELQSAIVRGQCPL